MFRQLAVVLLIASGCAHNDQGAPTDGGSSDSGSPDGGAGWDGSTPFRYVFVRVKENHTFVNLFVPGRKRGGELDPVRWRRERVP